MMEFAETYGFRHVTSSPLYPQSNGQAERAVKTVKQLLENSTDPHMALLSYRATPLSSCDLSPAELLMGRRIRTDVPQLKKLFVPSWPYLKKFRETDEQYKQKQKQYYDQRHRARQLPSLPDGTAVWVDTPQWSDSWEDCATSAHTSILCRGGAVRRSPTKQTKPEGER